MTSDGAAAHALPITTAFELPGARVVQSRGTCFGLVVRSMGLAKSASADLKTLRQGEVSQYTELLEDSRRHAIDRMVDNARLLGANAIIGLPGCTVRTRAGARAALEGLPLLEATASHARRFRRRRGEGEPVQQHWVASDEVFRDPTSGRVMRVWVDPTDGTRHYAETGP